MLTIKAETAYQDAVSALDDDDDAAFEADEKARIAALHKTAPEVIWLQIDDEAEQFQGWDAQTWCEDKINDTDLKYVRADTVPAGWIDIGTQMPPEKQSVLCCVNRCGVKVLRYEPAWTGACAHDHSWSGETVSGIGQRVAFNVVTHWMLLPKTPNDLGNRRAAFGASGLTDELAGNG